ncbi:hypothetical protein HK104_002898 [Borealophlyctis nickersoniae]|nr:hypothetical protein HK104_002898 [Borealophlyctis nickersoniae]
MHMGMPANHEPPAGTTPIPPDAVAVAGSKEELAAGTPTTGPGTGTVSRTVSGMVADAPVGGAGEEQAAPARSGHASTHASARDGKGRKRGGGAGAGGGAGGLTTARSVASLRKSFVEGPAGGGKSKAGVKDK